MVSWAEYAMGSVEAIEMFEGFISQTRENNVPARDRSPSTEMH